MIDSFNACMFCILCSKMINHTHRVQSANTVQSTDCIVNSTIVQSLPVAIVESIPVPRTCSSLHHDLSLRQHWSWSLTTVQAATLHCRPLCSICLQWVILSDRMVGIDFHLHRTMENTDMVGWAASPFEYQAWLHSLLVQPGCTHCLYDQPAFALCMFRLNSLFAWSGFTHCAYDQPVLTVCMIRLHSLFVW